MRLFALSLALLSTAAQAQDRPLANPAGLSQVIGYAWGPAEAYVPPADSGAVADGVGTLVWRDPGDGVSQVRVEVRRGTIEAVTIVDTTEATLWELQMVQDVLSENLGEPGADGFYAVRRVQALNPQAPYLDVAIDAVAGALTYRKPSAPPPAAPTPGRN